MCEHSGSWAASCKFQAALCPKKCFNSFLVLTHRVAKVVFFLVAKAVFISSKPDYVKNTSFNGFLELTHHVVKVRFFWSQQMCFH